MDIERRITSLEKALSRQRHISLVLICSIVAFISIGATAVVTERMTILTEKPIHVKIVELPDFGNLKVQPSDYRGFKVDDD